MILAVFLSLTTVCAGDMNQTQEAVTADVDDALTLNNDTVVSSGSQNVIPTSSKTASNTVFIKDSGYSIQILDGNGNAIPNKKVQITFKNKTTTKITNTKGMVYLKLDTKGTFALNYCFNEEGYAPINKTKTISVVGNSKTKLYGASTYVAYIGIKNQYVVTLTACGIKLPNKKITFVVNGKKYVRTTNANGRAGIDINFLGKGTYTIKYYFNGEKNAKAASGSAKITVKKGVPTKITSSSSFSVRENKYNSFTFKYTDVHGNPISSKTLVLTIGGKTYTQVTKNGTATFNIKLGKGVYKMTVNSYNTNVYKRAEKSFTLKVKPTYTTNNGFWLFGADMYDVNLKSMASYGVNQIFLNSHAITLYGKSAVSAFAKEAHSYGIKVHIWMQAFYNGGWISPVYSNGTYKYALFNSLIKEAKGYAAIDGIDGIHFDYLRFPGTAYKYKNGVSAINYFTKQACDALHKQNPNCTVSAAVMPEPSGMKYYYGQDIPTISKYLDVIVPMIYRGNYGASASWVKSTTEAFVKMSNGAQIWSGLQGYYSDSNVKKLPSSTLKNDADYASCGGAHGVIVFRYSLFNLFNFKYI